MQHIISFNFGRVSSFAEKFFRCMGIIMTLRELKPGEEGIVASIGVSGPLKRRIMDMGVTPGTTIKVIKVAPLGDPIEVNIRGYELSLRKDEAAQIVVK